MSNTNLDHSAGIVVPKSYFNRTIFPLSRIEQLSDSASQYFVLIHLCSSHDHVTHLAGFGSV